MALKKVVVWIFDGIFVLLIAAVVTLAVSSKLGKEEQPKLFGYQFMSVLSGSMSPTFETGSIVAVKSVSLQDIKKGDIVTFKEKEGRTVTHRVADIKDNQLITKGDANNAEDTTPVTQNMILGKVVYWVPLLGYPVYYARTKLGLALLLVIPGAYMIIIQTLKLIKTINIIPGDSAEGKPQE